MATGRPFTLAHFRRWALELELDNGEPWKLDRYQSLFIADVFRGIPISWLVVPEGNGKTTLLAGLALYHIQHTKSGYVAVAASTRDQAEWIYRQAAGFVTRSGLASSFKCLEGYRRIRFDRLDSRIQVFAADDRGGDGAIASLFILDELHRHRDLALYRTWAGKLRKRGGQLVAISTAGEVGGEFELERENFRKAGIAQGELERDGSFVRVALEQAVLHEYALEEDADPEDLRAVKRANPFSGIRVEDLRHKRELPGMTPGHWARFTCNRPSRADSSAITETEWIAAKVDDELELGEPCWIGLDVGWKWDTTAIVPFVLRSPELRLFGPATILEPPRDGTSLDPRRVEDALTAIAERNPVHTVVMDQARAEQLGTWIEEELGARVIDRTQSNPLAALDFERFMDALRNGWLWHVGDAGLTRHALNAIARSLPGGTTRFDRPHTSRFGVQRGREIDALIAAAMVHSTAAAELGVGETELEPMVAFG